SIAWSLVMDVASSLVMDAAYRRYRSTEETALQKIPLYKRYSVGKRKIQTRSTKCQKRPECSTRLVNHSGFVFQSFAPGPQKYAFTTIPPNTWSMCRPVSVK